MFTKAGPTIIIIGEIKFAEPKFAKGANDFDVCVQCTDATDEAQTDWWRGEFSQNYGKGNFASMTQAEITMKTLHNCGFQGDDLTELEAQLKGHRVPAMIKEREYEGKKYYDVQYIGASGGGNAPAADKVLGSDAVKSKMAALFGSKADVPQGQTQTAPAAPTQAPAATTAKPNPFAKRSA